MTRTMLIATVAALAVTAPAQAEGQVDRGQRGDQAQKTKASRGGQSAEAPQRRAETTQQRAPERVRAPARAPSVQRQAAAPRVERRVVERRAPTRVNAPVRTRSVERQRAPLVARQPVERRAAPVQRQQAAEQRARTIQTRSAPRQTVERRATAPRPENRAPAIEQRSAQQDGRAGRIATTQRAIDNRSARPEQLTLQRQNLWNSLAQRRGARIDETRSVRRAEAQRVTVGQRIDPVRYDNSVPFVYRTRYQDTPQHYYRYDDDAGYLYQVRRDSNIVSALFPLLGGAYSVGRPLPLSYSSYNVPYGYRSLYYDTPDYYYRYGSGAIYQVDTGTNLIQAIMALLTGQNFGVGQMLPASYSAYNVPYGYRDRYYDTADNWYRYNDGYIYQVDPRTRLIEEMYPMSYGGFAVGSPMPFGYDDYNVPYGYRDVYYDTPTYNYRYANGGIYQVDPTTQVIQALVALATGQNFGVGQAMPANYSVYNVPDAYRDRYYDTADNWYRYNDGTIYELDPRTRVIRSTYNV